MDWINIQILVTKKKIKKNRVHALNIIVVVYLLNTLFTLKLFELKPHITDVCTLSSWLKALEQKTNSSIRNDYIKLMVLALQYNELMCPFKDPPPETIDPLANKVSKIWVNY